MDYLNHFYGRNIELMEKLNKGSIQSIKTKGDGSCYITVYDIVPGIKIYFNDIHVSSLDLMNSNIKDGVKRYELNHCREGRFETSLKNKESVIMQPGDFAINPVNNAPSKSFFPIDHYHGVSIFITPSEIDKQEEFIQEFLDINYEEILRKLCKNDGVFLHEATPELDHIFYEIYRVPEKIVIPYLYIKVQELFLYLSMLMDEIEFTNREYFRRDNVEIINRIHNYVIKNSHKNYTYSQLTTIFPIKLTTMKECYKSIYNESIHDTIKNIRMEKGAYLLKTSLYNVTEIAMEVGYSSHSKFTEAFKKYYGITPTEYRKLSVLSDTKRLKGKEKPNLKS